MYLNLFCHLFISKILCLSYFLLPYASFDCVVYMEVWECCNGDRMVSGICRGQISILLTLGKLCTLGLSYKEVFWPLSQYKINDSSFHSGVCCYTPIICSIMIVPITRQTPFTYIML